MVFADGENLACRFKHELKDKKQYAHVAYCPDAYVWSWVLAELLNHYEVVRKYYYTGCTGDAVRHLAIQDELIALEIEAPRICPDCQSQDACDQIYNQHRMKTRGPSTGPNICKLLTY